MIKSNLVTIAYEVEDAYNNYYTKWDKFLNEVGEILDYYKFTIYTSGKTIINKKIGNTEKIQLEDIDNEFINNINYDKFLEKLKIGIFNCCDNYTKEDLYDQIISIIIGECIVLYKQAQILECNNLNIEHFKFITDDNNCCESCKALSQFALKTKNFDMNNIHPYCKQSILPLDTNKTTSLDVKIASFENIPQILIPIVKNITTKLKIQLKDYLSYRKFIFGDFNNLNIENDEILIPYSFIKMINIEELIVGELIKDKLLKEINIDEWKENFKIRKDSKILGDNCMIYSLPFTNNISSIDCTEYILQSSIKYIVNGNHLKEIDLNSYNKLKNLFKKEFIKG